MFYELFETDDNKYYLQLFYRTTDDEYLPAWDVPTLGERWTVEQFYTVFNELIPGDFESECSIE